MCIRHSTGADLEAILAWLERECDEVGTGFWCNRTIIEKAHETCKLLVVIERSTGVPVAFQVGGLLSPGILEVRPDRRGLGYGRRLVEYCLERAREQDECLLHIQCEPTKSVEFWEHMGFRLYSKEFGDKCPQDARFHAFQVLEKRFELAGDTVEVTIEFHDNYSNNSTQSRLLGVQEEGKRIALPRRMVFYRPLLVFKCSDWYVRIQVDGKELYSDKAKYPGADAVGVKRRSSELYVIDALQLPDPTCV